MPEIIVSSGPQRGAPIVMRERVTESALASEEYGAQLVERIGWALVDASEAEAPEAEPERGETGGPPPGRS